MDQVLRRAEEAKKGDSSPVELVAQRPMLARQLPLQAPQMQAMMNAVLLFFFSVEFFFWCFFCVCVAPQRLWRLWRSAACLLGRRRRCRL